MARWGTGWQRGSKVDADVRETEFPRVSSRTGVRERGTGFTGYKPSQEGNYTIPVNIIQEAGPEARTKFLIIPLLEAWYGLLVAKNEAHMVHVYTDRGSAAICTKPCRPGDGGENDK